MALNSLGLGFVFTAKDLASSTFGQLERSFNSLDRRVGLGSERIQTAFQGLATGLAVFTAGAATVGAAFSLANAAGRFEQSVAATGAVAGATAAELEQLKDAAIEAGVATQFSPTEATLGLRELAAAGFNVQESVNLLIPALDLAAGSLGELSPQQAAGLASQAMKAFGLATDEAGISVDRMLQAVNVFALSAGELPLALGTASRGAQTMNQSLSETLISLGLVKNVIPSVERASTAVAVAMERMANPETQAKLKGIGVAATDAGGGFRDFLDVLGDLAPELDRMTASERSAFLIKAFGTEALGGVNAILTQLTTGIRSNTGETVRGAQAIAFLRDQFENAGGTAAKFRDQMLNTFEGQKKLLAGSLETLAIVAGEPFTQVFKPIVTVVVDVVNTILGALRSLPAPAKRAFAVFAVAAGTILSLVGAAIAAKAGFALLVIGIKALGLTVGGLAVTFLPAIAIAGLLAITVAGLVVAFRRNVGGIADFAERVRARVSLAFEGLSQLFNEGGFSGAVRDELNRAENEGLKDFLVNVFLWANRIKNFFSGIADGFGAGVEAARPAIDGFLAALRSLGSALGILSERDDAGTAADKFRRFGSAGERVGQVLAKVFEFSARVLTGLVEFGTGVVGAWEAIAPGVEVVRGSFAQLGTNLTQLTAVLGSQSGAVQSTGSLWSAFGNVVAFVIGIAITIIGVFVSTVSLAASVVSGALGAVMSLFSGLADVVTGVVFIIGGIFTGRWADIWTGMKLLAFGVIDAVAGAVLELVGALGGAIDALAGLLGKNTQFQKSIRDFKEQARADTLRDFGLEGQSFTPSQTRPPVPPGSAPPPAPAVAAVRALAPTLASSPNVPAPPPAPPVTVNLQVDGETLARAVHRADQDAATRSFSPVPAY